MAVPEIKTTPVDVRIVKALSNGMSVVDIAEAKLLRLNMTERQVYSHVNNLKIKFNCNNVVHLVVTFLRLKIID